MLRTLVAFDSATDSCVHVEIENVLSETQQTVYSLNDIQWANTDLLLFLFVLFKHKFYRKAEEFEFGSLE